MCFLGTLYKKSIFLALLQVKPLKKTSCKKSVGAHEESAKNYFLLRKGHFLADRLKESVIYLRVYNPKKTIFDI